MEDVIFYLMITGIVIVNIVRYYEKYSKENKERNTSKPASVPAKETPKASSRKVSTPAGKDSGEKRETIAVKKPVFQPSVSSFNIEGESLESLDSLETISFGNEKQRAASRIYADEPISETEGKIREDSSIDLELDTPENIKRAFIHSLIFDRK